MNMDFYIIINLDDRVFNLFIDTNIFCKCLLFSFIFNDLFMFLLTSIQVWRKSSRKE